MAKKQKLPFELSSDDFGAVLNCAVRYAIGRQTYMPGIVVGFIKPLLPELSDKTLWCFEKDVLDAKTYGGYGDPRIDEPLWLGFLEAVQKEVRRRG